LNADSKLPKFQKIPKGTVTGETFTPPPFLEHNGNRLLLIPAAVLVVGLGLPLLAIYLIKSPLPDRHLFIWGVSFTNLIFMLWISAAIVAYTSIFARKLGSNVVLVFFLISLACCFPLVVGLKNDLTLKQALLDLPFFINWPFFLRPGYVLLQFLLPAGMVFYLALQLAALFKKRSGTPTYLLAALYLGLATFIGVDTLNQTGQPNLASLVNTFRYDGNPAATHPALLGRAPADLTAPLEDLGIKRFAITPSEGERFSGKTPLPEPVAATLPVENTAVPEPFTNQHWYQVEAKLDLILKTLNNPSLPEEATDRNLKASIEQTTPGKGESALAPDTDVQGQEASLPDQIRELKTKVDLILAQMNYKEAGAKKKMPLGAVPAVADAPDAEEKGLKKDLDPKLQAEVNQLGVKIDRLWQWVHTRATEYPQGSTVDEPDNFVQPHPPAAEAPAMAGKKKAPNDS
jgi:hypothetical protein